MPPSRRRTRSRLGTQTVYVMGIERSGGAVRGESYAGRLGGVRSQILCNFSGKRLASDRRYRLSSNIRSSRSGDRMVADLVPAQPPVVACLDEIDAVLDEMSTDAYAYLDPATQRAVVDRIRRIKARLAGHEMAAVRALDEGLGDKARTGEMLARTFGRDQHEAHRTVRVATNLSAAPMTREALACGELAETQAAVIAGAMAGLPQTVTPEQRQACETTLITDAKRFPIKDLRQRVLRITDVFKEPAEAARDEDEALRLRERRAWGRTEMWMVHDQDGTWRFGGRLPALQAEMLKASLDAIAAPRRRHLTAEQEHDQDDLTYSQRMGRAFAGLVEHLPTDKLPTTG